MSLRSERSKKRNIFCKNVYNILITRLKRHQIGCFVSGWMKTCSTFYFIFFILRRSEGFFCVHENRCNYEIKRWKLAIYVFNYIFIVNVYKWVCLLVETKRWEKTNRMEERHLKSFTLNVGWDDFTKVFTLGDSNFLFLLGNLAATVTVGNSTGTISATTNNFRVIEKMGLKKISKVNKCKQKKKAHFYIKYLR